MTKQVGFHQNDLRFKDDEAKTIAKIFGAAVIAAFLGFVIASLIVGLGVMLVVPLFGVSLGYWASVLYAALGLVVLNIIRSLFK